MVGEKMPVVHVYLWEGRTDEQIEKIIAGMTDVFVEQGTSPEAVRVLVHALPKSYWGKGGKPST